MKKFRKGMIVKVKNTLIVGKVVGYEDLLTKNFEDESNVVIKHLNDVVIKHLNEKEERFYREDELEEAGKFEKICWKEREIEKEI